MGTESDRKFNTDDYSKEFMQNLSRNLSVTGSENLSATFLATNITNDTQKVDFH